MHHYFVCRNQPNTPPPGPFLAPEKVHQIRHSVLSLLQADQRDPVHLRAFLSQPGFVLFFPITIIPPHSLIRPPSPDCASSDKGYQNLALFCQIRGIGVAPAIVHSILKTVNDVLSSSSISWKSHIHLHPCPLDSLQGPLLS